MADNIKVSVRLRGLISSEKNKEILWEAIDKKTISAVNSSPTSFSYDRVFAGNENNEVVYDDVCAPIVQSVINGYNGTIFAYGQTSSGKTYTLMGDGKFDFGISYHCVCNLFEKIQNMEDHVFLLRVSLMEIYNEKVVDLLVKKSENLDVQQDQHGNCKVVNLTEMEVQEPDQVSDLLRENLKKRKTGETAMNQRSSRSHLIFRMIIESRLRGNENAAVKVSHFNLVDLAGSEKASDNSGARFKEGVNINKSLLTLSKVIYELSSEKESQFIAFRNSKLTRILQNSLGGNALTAIICTVTPASHDETLSTLKFALNAKKIKNKPHVNEVATEETLIKSYANRIQRLTKQLEATKEEKDQETKMRRDMQEQIETLKKKFVQFVPQNKITRNLRRETWGGLDVARLKSNLFQPSRPLKLEVVDEENEVTMDNFDIDKTFSGGFFRNRTSTVSSLYSVDSTNLDENSKKENVAVQTDFLDDDSGSEKENLKLHAEKIAELEKELSDLKHFTTLEKQIYVDKHSEKAVHRSTSCSPFVPFLEKSRMSDDLKNSSMFEESFGVINSLINRKSQADRNIIDLNQEMFFQNLNMVIKKLSNILNVETSLPSIANPYFKVIYQLVNVIFQKHFIGNKVLIDRQVQEMFTLLTKIFVGFSDQENSGEQDSEMIALFDEISEKLLKDIEELISSNTETCVETKNSKVSNISCSESPNTDLIIFSCQCKDQIPLQEKSINAHLETISHLQSDCELLKKQIALSEDKIKVQEQVIANLENEMKLKSKCCAEMADNFTQTSYMSELNESYIESIDRKSLPKTSGDNLKKKEMSCSKCLKSQNYSPEQNVPDHELSELKSQLFVLVEQIKKIMESSIPKAYYSDITEIEPLKNLQANSVDSLKLEIEALKNRLHKIQFYIQDRTEHSEYIENKMLDKMAEISTLERQCSSTEMALQEKENQLNVLNANICGLRKVVSETMLSIRAMGVELKYLELDDIRVVDDLTYLKRIIKSFSDSVVDSHVVLKELHQQHSSRQSKITQTVENYPDLAALEEVRAHEFKERAHLCQENTSLKQKVEELIRKVDDLELDLKVKQNTISDIQKSYQDEIEKNLSLRKELQESFMETMQEHIKNVEDKYEEELKNQEKSIFGMMENKLSSLREEYKSDLEKKQEHYEKVILELTDKCEAIKSDLQGKLSEEINEHEETRRKLRSESRDFKNREETTREAYYKLKNKFKEYVKSVQDMRMKNAKYVKEKETQTNSDSAEACPECRSLKKEQSDLKTSVKLKSSEMATLELNNNNMKREIAALKKDLASKYALLQTCNCRLIAQAHDMARKVSQKAKVSDSAESDRDLDKMGKADPDPKEVLKLDVVQKAIEEARESERAIFNSGEGPASQEMCLLLRRKLNKKEKEISELKNMLSQKQLRVAKDPPKKLNTENMHPLDLEVVNNFTPKTVSKPVNDALLNVQPKKILHEKNKPEKVEAPKNKWFMTEAEEEMARKLEDDPWKIQSEPNCKQQ